jgi:hypothetical protein
MIRFRRMRLAVQGASMRLKNACRVLVKKPERRRPLGRLGRRREDNIKMHLREII